MIRKIRPFCLFLLLYSIPFQFPGEAVADLNTLDSIFRELGIYIGGGIGDFALRKDIRREGRERGFRTILAEKNKKVIRLEVIKNIDQSSADKFVERAVYIIDSLYKRIKSPYPGMVSNSIECPDQFKPELTSISFKEERIPVYILGGTPRFTYGACAEELIKYRGALTFIYDKRGKTLYRIELFMPKAEFRRSKVLDILGSFKFLTKSKARQAVSFKTKAEVKLKAKGGRLLNTQENSRHFKGYNLIIIGIEPLGAKHIGAYGYFRNTTPQLDKFSKKAFLFKNAISPASWTLPAFMSWFTSLYPSQHKIVNKYSKYTDKAQVLANLSELSPKTRTLAEILKENGYLTAAFTGGAGVSGVFGYSKGFDVYEDSSTFGGFDITLPLSLSWIKSHKRENFFLFLQGYDVHGRHRLQEGFKNKFVSTNYKGKYRGTIKEYWHLRNLSLDNKLLNMTDEDVDFWRAWYDTKIYESDKKLGAFLKELKNLGLMDKTILIISSGSGNEFYEHGKFDHGLSLYQELIQVPLIIKIPGKEGRIIESQVSTIDIMPTVLALLNVNYDKKIEKQMQGVSLIPLLKGEKMRLDSFSETDFLLAAFKRSLNTSDGWKFIYSMDTEQRELYNLKSDPQELNNLIEEESRKAYELEEKLFKHLESMR